MIVSGLLFVAILISIWRTRELQFASRPASCDKAVSGLGLFLVLWGGSLLWAQEGDVMTFINFLLFLGSFVASFYSLTVLYALWAYEERDCDFR